MTALISESDSSFEEIFKTHYKLLCNAANRILDDKEASEDVVQEVFLKWWNKKDDLKVIQSIKSYLYKATINTSLNYLESKKKTVRFEAFHEKPDTREVDDKIHLSQLEAKINDAINSLPPKCKVIFLLSRYEGMKYQQIADHLDLSVKTVENQMGKALQIMRDRLKPYLTREFMAVAATIGLAALMSYLSMFLIAFFQK